MKAIITVGVSASGKSTIAKEYIEQGYKEINRDNARRHYCNMHNKNTKDQSLWSVYKINKQSEKWVTDFCNANIEQALEDKQSIIISDTNLNKDRRKQLQQKLEQMGYTVEVLPVGVDLSYFDVLKRDQQRLDTVGETVLMRQWEQWQAFLQDENIIQKKVYSESDNKLDAIMCDLDGTLAIMGDRGPFDWDKVDRDTVNIFLANILDNWLRDGKQIVFMSGRSKESRELTKDWIRKHLPRVAFGINTHLFMRSAGDDSKDYIVKERLFWEKVANFYNIKAVFEDRPQVVRLWHWLKLPVYALGNPYIEF